METHPAVHQFQRARVGRVSSQVAYGRIGTGRTLLRCRFCAVIDSVVSRVVAIFHKGDRCRDIAQPIRLALPRAHRGQSIALRLLLF